jgi:hypothetical protein
MAFFLVFILLHFIIFSHAQNYYFPFYNEKICQLNQESTKFSLYNLPCGICQDMTTKAKYPCSRLNRSVINLSEMEARGYFNCEDIMFVEQETLNKFIKTGKACW